MNQNEKTPVDGAVYSSKELKTSAREMHGSTGWRKLPEGNLEELLFNGRMINVPRGWMPAAEFRRHTEDVRRKNREYYDQNPSLKGKKIAEKKCQRESRRGFVDVSGIPGLPWSQD